MTSLPRRWWHEDRHSVDWIRQQGESCEIGFMEDADVIRKFLRREQSWLRVLESLRGYHQSQLGKTLTPVQWIGGQELGRFSWLGYYWQREIFWFGFGLYEGKWRPLIEADTRSDFCDTWNSLRAQLQGTWEMVKDEGLLYRRLWASESDGAPEATLNWFVARSRELHEYVLEPER